MIQIRDKKDCCGCWACVQICPKQCISMEEDQEGFKYPKVDLSTCINCGLCEKTCPIINQKEENKDVKSYAAQSKDEDILLGSSSGGVFSEIAINILNEGGVVFGCRMDGTIAVHDFAENFGELALFRGSKYIQSEIREAFKRAEQLLKDGRKVLFSGTPCQISALKLYLRKEYINLITVDFICHGVPSPKIFRKYFNDEITPRLKGAETGKNTVFQSLKEITGHPVISFRDKKLGWKKYGFSVRKVATNGSDKNSVFQCVEDSYLFYETKYDNAYLKAFISNILTRPSCFSCPVRGFKHSSDITLGDLWGADRLKFEKCNNNNCGISIVIVNTKVGETVINSNEHLIKEIYPLNEILAQNPSYYKSPKEPEKREKFFKNFESGNYKSIEKLLLRSTKPTFKEWVRINVIKCILALGLIKLFKR